MTAERLTEQTPSQAWDARCRACGAAIARVSADAPWVRAKCMNWRASRTLGSDRNCPLYNKWQQVYRH